MKCHAIYPARNTFRLSVRQAGCCIPILVLLLMGTATYAQGPEIEKAKADKAKSEIADYVRGRYKVRHMRTEMKKTEHGPAGSIHIIGDMTPQNISAAMAEKEKPDRARQLARTLILDEPDIFGVTDPHELKEETLYADKNGVTHIRYKRYIRDIPLDRMEIMAHIGPDELLSSISAEAVPVPPELYQAAAMETLAEGVLPSIIEQDLKAANVTFKSIRIKMNRKIAIPVPPYVLWQVAVSAEGSIDSWTYKIDAFSGKVIERRSALIE